MKIQKSYWIWGFWKKKSRPPTSPKFQTHKKIFLHTFTPIRFLFKVCPKTYKSFIKIKGPKTHHSLHSLHSLHLTHSLFTLNWLGGVVPRTSPPTTFGTERARLGTFRGFGTERARLGTFRGFSIFFCQNLKIWLKITIGNRQVGGQFSKNPLPAVFLKFFFQTPNFTKFLNP